ncbi:MAG: DeoR family transcriptional regulator [Fibrobacteres bacterium]|nr:DeoR family transcriptional regulator [Fibrobacterota bacterium]
MLAHERQESIMEALKRRPTLTIHELLSLIKASPATVRRDLDFLEKKGSLVRTHGGVVHSDHIAGEPTYDQRLRESPASKRAIAETAAAMVPEGASVYVDAGTTCLEVGRILLGREDLAIFTNSSPLINIPFRRRARLVCIGGELREISRAMVGGLALDWLTKLRFDIAFLGASGLASEGISTTELSEAEIKRQAMSRAKQKILLADGVKWDVPSTFLFSSWNAFDIWITDSSQAKRALQKQDKITTKVILTR